MTGAGKRLVLETLGWLLLAAGLAALVLPGPGLLLIFGGLALLAQQYTWAERWLDPIELRAMRGAAESVETWPRIVMSTIFALGIGALGALWIAGPEAPSWWFFDDGSWWLPGGLWAGVTLIGSAVIALALIVYAFRRFHGKPDAVAALEKDIEHADEVRDRD